MVITWPLVIELADRVVLRRTWSQRFLIAFCALVTLGCFASAGAVVFVDAKFSKLQRISLSGVLAPASTSTDSVGVQNILLVGVDNEAGLASDNPIRNGRDGGTRSDTIMLLRVDPAKEQAALLSFPRDLWLPIGTSSRRDKINAALELGGPDLLIKTLAANFNIGVTHYVQVDFAQFEKLVDTIDGVAMPFDRPVRDEYTGLDIEESGSLKSPRNEHVST